MGLNLEFIAGDKQKLTDAVRDVDYDILDDPAAARVRADMSLHIEPRDLNTLSHSLAAFSQQAPMDLRSHLTVIVDEEDRGLLGVDDKWVAYVAAVPSGKATEIADAWAERMRELYKDSEIRPTDAMRSSIEDLVQLCKTALKDGLPVVHIWTA